MKMMILQKKRWMGLPRHKVEFNERDYLKIKKYCNKIKIDLIVTDLG